MLVFLPTFIDHILNEPSTDPYPFGIDEVFDAYRIIVESKGKAIGMAGEDINIVLSGDSA
jgi:acetyl esterase/lipase